MVTRMALAVLALGALAAAGPVEKRAASFGPDSSPAQDPAPAGGDASPAPEAGRGQAPAPAVPTVTTAPTAPDPSERVFGAEAGVILNAVRADGTDDFETVLGRLAEALAASADPVRRQQAQGWRVFRAAEPGPSGSVLYVFLIDPVVPGADYGVARVLAEAFPDEAGELYALYSGAYADGQTLLNLEPVEAFESLEPAPATPQLLR